MSLVTRSSKASLDANQAFQSLAGALAGADIDLFAPCYLKSSDSLVYMSNGAAANEAAEFIGFSARSIKSGEPVTLFGQGTRFRYGSGLTLGDVFYIGATAGRLDTAATTGDTMGTVVVVSDTDVMITRSSSLNQNVVADGALNGTKLANVGNANVIGGVPEIFRIDIAAGALANTDVVMTNKVRVIDAWLVLRGAGVATTTLQVKNGSSAITDAMAASGSNKAVVRAAQIDAAAHEIAAGGTLRVTSATGASQPDATVYVLAIPVA